MLRLHTPSLSAARKTAKTVERSGLPAGLGEAARVLVVERGGVNVIVAVRGVDVAVIEPGRRRPRVKWLGIVKAAFAGRDGASA